MIDTRSSRRWWALGALNLAVLAVSLDGTILSVALPTLAGALHATESDLQWFSSGYLLVLAAGMLPAGLAGDRFGRKRVLLLSVATFGVGSALCAAAPSSGAFIAARALLGLAGAGVIVMALSALTVLFSDEERPKAVGVWAAANFLAMPLGPILGGWLLTHAWWGWVFLINVPVAVIGVLAGHFLVPESRAPRAPAFDAVGLATATAGLIALTYGVIQAGEHGWGTAGAAAPIAAGVALLAGFGVWERHVARRGGDPLVDPGLFRSRSYLWGVILLTIGVLAMMGVLFTLPQYFQGVRGTDAMGSGLRLLPLIGGLLAGALPADRIARRIGTKASVAGGFLVLAAGLALGGTTDLGAGETFVAAWMALVGVGMGLTMATATSAALADLTEERSGVGSAVLQACNKTGGPLGTAILGSVVSSAYLARLDLAGLPDAARAAARASVFGGVGVAHRLHSSALLASVRGSFVHGMDVALLASAAVAVAGAVTAVLFLPGGRRAVPEADAEAAVAGAR
jgi:EmrB/QacA subfamily drug resistance transporter